MSKSTKSEKHQSVPEEANLAMVSMLEMSRLEYHLENFPRYKELSKLGKKDELLGIKGRSCTVIFSGERGVNVPIELYAQNDKKNRIGIILNPEKIETPHMDFFAYRSGSMVHEKKEIEKSKYFSSAERSTKFPQKKGVTRSGMGMGFFVTNHAKWDREEGVYHEKGSTEIAAKAVWRRYFKDDSNKKDADGKVIHTRNLGGKGVMTLNEAIVFQKKNTNPVAGIFINITDGILPLEKDLRRIARILKRKSRLKLYVYDYKREENIIRQCINPEAYLQRLIKGVKIPGDSNLVPYSGVGKGAEDETHATIGDSMRRFIKEKNCDKFLKHFKKLNFDKQKILLQFVWGGEVADETGQYDKLKEEFAKFVAEFGAKAEADDNQELRIKQIFNDEMRNQMLQIMAETPKRSDDHHFVGNYLKVLGDYDGTFFSDESEYQKVKKEMIDFVSEGKMPQRVLISNYVASIRKELYLITALQYAWNVGGRDDFQFGKLKAECGITDESPTEKKIQFNNEVRRALVEKIDSVKFSYFKNDYNKIVIPEAPYEKVKEGVKILLERQLRVLTGNHLPTHGSVGAPPASAPAPESKESKPKDYKFLISQDTLEKVKAYKEKLQRVENTEIGVYLAFNILRSRSALPPGIDEGYFRYTDATSVYFSESITPENRRKAQEMVEGLTDEEFLELLIQTKKPKFFAESAIMCDAASDWNKEEISILGDVNCAIDVDIHDNGRHKLFGESDIHATPFPGTLLFSPGALLRGRGGQVDISEVVVGGSIDQEKFTILYERRLLPVLLHANEDAKKTGQKAFVTVPGMGCGQFAGEYIGEINPKFKEALRQVIERNQDKLGNIAGVYLDLYDKEDLNNKKGVKIGNTDFICRALTSKNEEGRPQLCSPEEYGANYKDCKLYSVVAWDHVSWPGNDFYTGQRATDDGVKGAATDAIAKLTGVAGTYSKATRTFNPKHFGTWIEQIIDTPKLDLIARDNVTVFTKEASPELDDSPSPSPATPTHSSLEDVGQTFEDQVKKYVENPKSAEIDPGIRDELDREVNSQLRVHDPKQVYKGCGIKATFDGDGNLAIEEIFAPKFARFIDSDTNHEYDHGNNLWLAGKLISKIEINGAMTDVSQITDLSLIAEAFHSEKDTRFEVLDPETSEKYKITCLQKNKNLFVTKSCESAKDALEGKVGDKYNVDKHGVRAIDPDKLVRAKFDEISADRGPALG